jgi:hypothetical protein
MGYKTKNERGVATPRTTATASLSSSVNSVSANSGFQYLTTSDGKILTTENNIPLVATNSLSARN